MEGDISEGMNVDKDTARVEGEQDSNLSCPREQLESEGGKTRFIQVPSVQADDRDWALQDADRIWIGLLQLHCSALHLHREHSTIILLASCPTEGSLFSRIRHASKDGPRNPRLL